MKGEGLTAENVARRMADVLELQGYVKDSYAQAIVDREAVFPTALDMIKQLSETVVLPIAGLVLTFVMSGPVPSRFSTARRRRSLPITPMDSHS